MTDRDTKGTKAARLKQLLSSKIPTILMEAHNGLSAKLVEEAGFEAIWASGLSISAALGVRDNNEASWTQVLEVLEFMADASDLPILLDGDTGYGNFNNVRRLVRKLEQRHVAGVCLEDKLFPKTNSFIDGERQALASVDEFCGKIRAAKDTQHDPSFVVVARTEAFIAGWGLEEALLRATAYAESGADAILCHSKRSDSADIDAFMKHWRSETPVVIVPTKYPSVPLSKLVAAGVYNFIFANHSLRTVITALQTNLKKLKATQDLMSIESEIVPVSEVFRVQDAQELKRSEKRYLPATAERARALVLAATKGDFGKLVRDKPKAMLYLHGKPILSWHVEAFRRQGICDVGVVRGYRKEAVDLAGLTYFDNDAYAQTGELYSLYTARAHLSGDMVIAYGDIIFDDFILQNLLAHDGEIRIAVDVAMGLRQRADAARDFVATRGVDEPLGDARCQLIAIGSNLPAERISGEWIGLTYFTAAATERLVARLDRLAKTNPDLLRKADLLALFNLLVEEGEQVTVIHSYGHWRDLDDQRALLDARSSQAPPLP